MKKLMVAVISLMAISAYAETECKVSMMGRVCYENGKEVVTAAHMKSETAVGYSTSDVAVAAGAQGSKEKVEVAKK